MSRDRHLYPYIDYFMHFTSLHFTFVNSMSLANCCRIESGYYYLITTTLPCPDMEVNTFLHYPSDVFAASLGYPTIVRNTAGAVC